MSIISIFAKMVPKVGINLTVLLRVIQGVFALVVLALSSFGKHPSPTPCLNIITTNTNLSVVQWYNATTVLSSPSELNFLIFAALWSLLSLLSIELLPRFFPRGTSSPPPLVIVSPPQPPYIRLPTPVPKTHLTLPIELANALFYISGFLALCVFLSRLLFCRGPPCHAAQADAAFASFSFARGAGAAVSTVLVVVKARRWGGCGGLGHVGTGAMPGVGGGMGMGMGKGMKLKESAA
jgi:hypothetical protein